MNEQELIDEIQHNRALIKDHTERLRIRERQAAKYGLATPPEIQIEITEILDDIRRCEERILSVKSKYLEPTYAKKSIYEKTLIILNHKQYSYILSFSRVFDDYDTLIGTYNNSVSLSQKEVREIVEIVHEEKFLRPFNEYIPIRVTKDNISRDIKNRMHKLDTEIDRVNRI